MVKNGKLPTICLSVFDHFAGLALTGLSMASAMPVPKNACPGCFYTSNHKVNNKHWASADLFLIKNNVGRFLLRRFVDPARACSYQISMLKLFKHVFVDEL